MEYDLRKVGGALATLATYTGLVVGVWALPWNRGAKVLLLVILILTGALVAAVTGLLAEQRRIRELRSDNDQLMARLADASYVSDLTDGMIALVYCLSQPPLADTDNHYFEVIEKYRVDGDDASYSYGLRGRRVASGVSETIRLKVSGDTPADAVSLVAEASDATSGEPLAMTFVRDDPYFKVMEITFKSPISTGDEFDVSVSLRWGGTFPRVRRSDYLFSQWSLYAGEGIERLSCAVSYDLQLRNVTLEELETGHRRRSAVQPKLVDANGRCELSWVVPNPTALYLLRFEKVLP